MVKYELESTLRRGQDHQQKQSEAVIRVTVFISRKDLISSQKWLLSTRVYFHTSGFILPLKHQGPLRAQSPQSQHSLRPGSGSSNDWDHIKRYRHLKLETILKSLRIQKVWTVVRRTLKHIGCIQSTIGPTRRDSTVRRSTRRARLPTTPGSVHPVNPNMKILEDLFFSTTSIIKNFSKTRGNPRPPYFWPHYIHPTALLTVHILIFLHSASAN